MPKVNQIYFLGFHLKLSRSFYINVDLSCVKGPHHPLTMILCLWLMLATLGATENSVTKEGV